MLDLVQIFIACILVLLNAFFVAAEFSMVKLRATQVQTIQHEYGLRGRILAHIHQHLDAYLSASPNSFKKKFEQLFNTQIVGYINQ